MFCEPIEWWQVSILFVWTTIWAGWGLLLGVTFFGKR